MGVERLSKLFRRHGGGLLFTLAASLVVLGLHALGLLDRGSYRLLDYSFQVRGPLAGWAARNGRPADSLGVVLIDVDDETYRILGEIGWPYPRADIWSRAIRNLVDAGAKAVVFDIQFDSRDAATVEELRVHGGHAPEGFV